jgi:hypothetical protein
MEFGKVIQWTTDIAQGPVRDVFTQWGHLIAITAACVAIALFIKSSSYCVHCVLLIVRVM